MWRTVFFGLKLATGALALGAGAFYLLVNLYDDSPAPTPMAIPEDDQAVESAGTELDPGAFAVTGTERMENGRLVTSITPVHIPGAMPLRDPRENGGAPVTGDD
ncbi:MAG: hypothetical protein HUU29_13520 [Planctomycetaceae bacterium]|nr:hypothetical protein [Planctomycetaceae bacterium]